MNDDESPPLQVFLFMGVIEAATGVAVLLWGDNWFPLLALPLVLGLTHAKVIGIVLFFVAAPMTFFFYYLRHRQEADKSPVSRGPVEKL